MVSTIAIAANAAIIVMFFLVAPKEAFEESAEASALLSALTGFALVAFENVT